MHAHTWSHTHVQANTCTHKLILSTPVGGNAVLVGFPRAGQRRGCCDLSATFTLKTFICEDFGLCPHSYNCKGTDVLPNKEELVSHGYMGVESN
jgi:hypothetical protein